MKKSKEIPAFVSLYTFHLDAVLSTYTRHTDERSKVY